MKIWPFSNSSSRVVASAQELKIEVDFELFEKNTHQLDVTLSEDIWELIEWLSITTNSTYIDVIRALLFKALYGHIAYEQLIQHCNKKDLADNWQRLSAREIKDLADNRPRFSAREIKDLPDNRLRFSARETTVADIRHTGKSNVNRKLSMPQRMWIDLDRQAVKAQMEPSRYVRNLLIRVLQGEIKYNHWQDDRAELENRVRPPSGE